MPGQNKRRSVEFPGFENPRPCMDMLLPTAMQGKLSGAEMLSLATSGSEEQAAAMMGSLSPEVGHHSVSF